MENNIMRTMQNMEIAGKETLPLVEMVSPAAFVSPVFNYGMVM